MIEKPFVNLISTIIIKILKVILHVQLLEKKKKKFNYRYIYNVKINNTKNKRSCTLDILHFGLYFGIKKLKILLTICIYLILQDITML